MNWFRIVALISLSWMLGCAGSSTHEESSERPIGSAPEDDDPSVAGLASESETDATRSRPAAESDEADRSECTRLGRVFSNDPVTLDFRNAAVRRALRLFRERAHLEIVLAPSVDGRVTVQVEETAPSDAFRALLRAADLECRRKDETIWIQPRAEASSADGDHG